MSESPFGDMGNEEIQAFKRTSPEGSTMVKPHSATRTRIVCPLENTLRIRLDDKSRMKGDFHVRFGESLRGRFPRATRVRRAWRAVPITGAVNRQAKANRDVTWRVQVPLEAVMTGTPSRTPRAVS